MLTRQPSPDLPLSSHRGRSAPSAASVRRYLSCIRYREILVLQGSPLLGAVFALGAASVHRLGPLLLLTAASFLLVAHVFVFNDWAGVDADLNDAAKVAQVFATKGISRDAIRRLWSALLASSLVLFAPLGQRPWGIAVAIAALSFLYSWPASPAKSRPILSSLLHVAGGALHFLLGVSTFQAIDRRSLALALFFGLVFAAGHLNQEVRDFDGDVRNRIRTNAATFGKVPAFLAGLLLFTAAYVHLVLLARSGILPAWLAAVALLYPLHLAWSLQTLAEGLTFAGIDRLQTRYRALFVLIGAALLAALLASAPRVA